MVQLFSLTLSYSTMQRNIVLLVIFNPASALSVWVVNYNPTIQFTTKETFSGFVNNKLFNYDTGSPIVKSAKEKIEELDEAKKKVAYSVIDGDMMQYYKSFKASLEVIPDGEGSLVKWLCEFEKASEEVPNPDIIRDFAAKNFKEIDEYLLKA